MEQKNGLAMGITNTTESIFTSYLATATSGANNATVRYLFNTFGSDELITTGMLFIQASCRVSSFSESAPQWIQRATSRSR
jgi:hypothetical protein